MVRGLERLCAMLGLVAGGGGLGVQWGTLRVSLAVAVRGRVKEVLMRFFSTAGNLDSAVASPKLQHAYFGDFSVAITQDWP